MSPSKIDTEMREQRILDAASALISHYGYDKTTVDDIAREAGVSKGAIYLHFKGKEALFEGILRREMFAYGQSWLDYIEADPQGGTIGGLYRAVLHAINSNPLMSAMIRRDRRIMGSYLRKPDHMFTALRSGSLWADTLRAMQEAGAVRQDRDPVVMAHIMDLFSFGLVSVEEFKQSEDIPPFHIVMETMADMMDELLTPEDGGNREAGRAIIQELAATSRRYFEQMQPHNKSNADDADLCRLVLSLSK
jgi:AcrR family transcriptional regulator